MDTTIAGGGFWQAALIWGAVAAILVWVLARTVRRAPLEQVRWALPVAAALFWGIFATVLVYGMWATYYEHFYSSRLRLIIPIYAPLLYAAVGTFLWWAARRLPGKPAVTFCLLGGVESLVEHGIAIYGLGILDRVPLLQGSDPLAVLAFAFPEYVVYWGLVLALAALLARFRIRRQTRRREGSRHV
jgi:hypothetical protein